MPDLTSIAKLAASLADKPWLGELYQEAQPQLFEEVLKLAASPFFRFKLFSQQVAFVQDPSRNKWAIAGNRGGKTVCGLVDDVADCLGLDTVTKKPSEKYAQPPKVWIVTDTEETANQVIARTLVEQVLGTDQSGILWNMVDDEVKYTEKSGFSDNFVGFTNGASLEIKFSTQDRKVFQGRAIDKIHHDEVQPRDIYGECLARLVDRNGYFMGTMTPIFDRKKGIPWFWNEVYLKAEEKGVAFHRWSMLDNPYLSQAAKDRLLREWDEDERDARVYGSFTPIGVSLAWKPTVLNRIREGCRPPLPGQVELDEEGNLTFRRTA
mgnify:FL=1